MFSFYTSGFRKYLLRFHLLLFFFLVATKSMAQTSSTNALDFDGLNDKVSIPDNNSLDMTSNYTLEVWVYPTQFIHLAGIIDKYQSANANGYMIRLDGTEGKMSFDERVTTNNVLTLNTWNHVAAVNSNGTRRLYVNGVEVALGSSSFNVISNGDPLCLGIDWNSTSRSFKGKMDEVRIWNVARTATQISESINRMMAGNETGLVAYYRFDQGTAGGANTGASTLTNLATATGTALNGTLSGFSLNSTATSNWTSGYSSFQPLVTTTTASSVVATSAGSGGNVVHEGGASVTARGLVWSTSVNPTVSSSKTTDASGPGTFTSSITGLSPNTIYYYRSYATNTNGTSYGNELNFTTLQATPSISYPSASYTFGVGSAITPVALTNSGGAPDAAQVSTLAGDEIGFSDGIGTSAKFRYPRGVAVDGSGNVYVADQNNQRIRKIDPLGNVSTIAGNGSSTPFTNGQGSQATFFYPAGIAVDASGNVYVTDANNQRIRKIDPSGTVSTFAGTGARGSVNGPGSSASFNQLLGLTIDPGGNLYVAEFSGCRIRKIDPSANVTNFAGTGDYTPFTNGSATTATFAYPSSVATDGTGNFYIADYGNHLIRKISSAGQVSTYAGTGVNSSVNGPANTATFSYPHGVVVDSKGNVYVTEPGKTTIRKIDPSGQVTTFAGSQNTGGSTDGSLSNARFSYPYGLAVDASDNIYVADFTNHRIRKISSYRIEPALPSGMYFNTQTGQISGTPTTVQAARAYTIYSENSAGAATTQITIGVSGPPTVTTQAATNVTGSSATLNATVNASGSSTSSLTIKYSTVEADINAGNGTDATVSLTSVSGSLNTSVSAPVTGLTPGTTYYFRVSATNTVGTSNGSTLSFNTADQAPSLSYGNSSFTFFMGNPITSISLSGGQTVVPMNVTSIPYTGLTIGIINSIVFDPDRNCIYISDRTHQITKLDLSTRMITLIAGSVVSGNANGIGSAARFNMPFGLALDRVNSFLYVADYVNNRICRIDLTSNEVTTIAGSEQGYLDATGTAAKFTQPSNLTLDGSGNLYISEFAGRIRKLELSTNTVTTMAGSINGLSIDGVGTSAVLRTPGGLKFDGAGNIYFVESNSNLLRKLDVTTERVTTVSGGLSNISFADGIGTNARFGFPMDVTMDATGNIYIADFNNSRIRRVSSNASVTTLAGSQSKGTLDGFGADARLSSPRAVTTDANNNIYFSDLNYIRKISRFSISPALPAGLNFNENTGEISGTPTALSTSRSYTIQGGNAGGNGSVTITLQVTSSLLTTDVTSVTSTTASSGGTVDASFTGVIERGVVYSTTTDPAITDINDTKIADAAATIGTFTSSITGLAANTRYYLRSYLTHSRGTDYGPQKTFRTNQLGAFADITKKFGDANFSLTAPTSVSSGAFSYASSDPAVATISGRTVTITGAGTTTITATQAAAGEYASISKTLTLTVNKATPTIVLNIPSTTTLAAANDMSITATASNGEEVTVTIGSGTATGTLTPVSAGSYRLNGVSQAGNLVFNATTAATATHAAGSKTVTMNVTLINQTITFNAFSPVTFVNGLTQSLTATSSSNLPVSYTVVSGPGSVAGSTLNITGSGSIVVRASHAGNETYNPAPDVERTLVVNPGAPVVSSFTPASAREGDVVTITGQYFDNVSGVSFGGTDATSFTVVSNTSITAILGTGTTGLVSVTTTGGTDSKAGFRYKVLWTGSTNAFNQSANWSGSRVPQTDDDIVFDPSAASDLELDENKTVGNVDFNGSSRSLKLGAHNLIVKGNVTMPGNITGSGKLIMRGSSSQSIKGGGQIPDLEIDNAAGVSIDASGSEVEVSGVLRSTAGILTTNGKLRLTSNSAGTARVAPVTGTVTGNVIAERYVQRNNNADGTGRAWRLVSIPVSGSGTLRDFFMNGRNGQDLTAATAVSGESDNAGTPIVGHDYASASAATAAGFDWIGVSRMVSSLRFYSGDAGGGSFNSSQVPNLSTTYAAADQGYMVFTRGDRKLTFPDANSSSATTFRSTGTLKTGNQQVSVAPASTSKYTLVGNPYMSVLDLAAFYTTNSAVINPSFWIWEPNIAGTHKQGEYINVYKSGTEWVTNTGTYINPQLIESGVAFFVEPVSSLATATNITIMETHKSSETSAGLAPLSTEPKDERGRLFVKLQRADARGERQLIDGVALEFHKDLKETPGDVIDHEKLRNGISRGSLWVTNSGKSLSSEGRPWPALDSRRSIPLQMSNIGNQTLLVSIDPRGMNKPGLKAWLKDNSLRTEQEIDLGRVNEFDFIGTGSSAKDSMRFEIVYMQQPLPPVKFINTSAKKVASGVDVTWETPLDAGASYEIIRSADLESFTTVHKKTANGKSSNTYIYTDTKPHPVVNYYRVVSKNATGQLWMSNWMRVNMSMKAGDWKLYPNPSAETNLQLELAEVASGTYTVSVFDQQGRQVDQQRIEHGGGNRVHGLILPKRLTTGIYILQVSNAKGEIEQTMKWMRE